VGKVVAVAVALGTARLGERLSVQAILGAAIIALAVVLVQVRATTASRFGRCS
jgi:drug/metabolite transporter (DMT)-like permease